MKIYHKKNFGTGLTLLFMGTGFIILNRGENFDPNKVWTVLLCLFVGGRLLIRSLSREFSREDKLEELDERNRYVALRSAQKSFQVTQTGCLVLMVICFLLSETQESEALLYVGLGFAFAWSLAELSEVFAMLYYEKHS